MIVVTTPAGNIGHHVVDHLLDAGEKVRVIARHPDKLAQTVRDRVEIVEGTHGDPAVVDRAFAGADAVFWLVAPAPHGTLEETYLEFSRPAAEALRRHGVARVVSVTALGRDTQWENDAGLATASLRMADLIMSSGVAFRELALPGFMDNALQQVATIKDQNIMFGPLDPNKKLPATATRDTGEFAATLLRDKAWTGQEHIAVLGPEDLSASDMAAIMSEVLGREIHYRQIPFDAFKTQLLDRGGSESFAQGYIDMMRAKNDGMDNAAAVLGRKEVTSTTFRQWCEEELKPAVIR